jgi:hypothetical protein
MSIEPPARGGTAVGSFAVILASRPTTDGILMMLDDRPEAEEIASELCRRGYAVTVREITAAERHAQEA